MLLTIEYEIVERLVVLVREDNVIPDRGTHNPINHGLSVPQQTDTVGKSHTKGSEVHTRPTQTTSLHPLHGAYRQRWQKPSWTVPMISFTS